MRFALKQNNEAFLKARRLIEDGKGLIDSPAVLDIVHRILKARNLTATFDRKERDGRKVHLTFKNVRVSIEERIEILPLWDDEKRHMWYWLPYEAIGTEGTGSLPRVLVFPEPTHQTFAEAEVVRTFGGVKPVEVFAPDGSGLFTQQQCVDDLRQTADECFGPVEGDDEITRVHVEDRADFISLAESVANGEALKAFKQFSGLDSFPRDYIRAESRNYLYVEHKKAGGKE